MTLRDYFAAFAMQGELAGCGGQVDDKARPDIARDSYAMADAMLAERAK
jgi:hypothetical protein